MENGVCKCTSQPGGSVFRGADCSYQALKPWGSTKVVKKGHAWAYFVFEGQDSASAWKLQINTNHSLFNTYISFGKDANPNQFNHDIKFLKIPAGDLGLELTER